MRHIEPVDKVNGFCKSCQQKTFCDSMAVHILRMVSYAYIDWPVATNTDQTFRTECSFHNFCTVRNLDECMDLNQ